MSSNIEELLRKARKGDASAQYELGQCFSYGTEVEIDHQAAFEWYSRAAEKGYDYAQGRLGWCYEYGMGVEKNEQQAAIWYRKAAERGDAAAQDKLGRCYEEGKGVRKNLRSAAKWYSKSAGRGNASALLNLARCYEKGFGVEVNLTRAVTCYWTAAHKGDTSDCDANWEGLQEEKKKAEFSPDYINLAQYYLAKAYERGIGGLKKDKQKATHWYRIALRNGLKHLAESELERLESNDNAEKANTKPKKSDLINIKQGHYKHKSKKLDRLKKAIDNPCKEGGAFLTDSKVILNWLLQKTNIDDLDLPRTITTMGSNPYQKDILDELFGSLGFEIQSPNQNTDIIVVGRGGGDLEALDSCIYERQEGLLKIYSQEMFMLFLMTGQDPFDADINVLLEFGRNHPVLEYLMEHTFKWPSSPDTGTGMRKGVIELDADESPLTAAGYHVGESGLSSASRRKILARVINDKLIFPDTYSNEKRVQWGIPGSAKRLKRTAMHIVYDISYHGKRLGRDSQAVQDWISDLDWLKKEYYVNMQTKFRWPDIGLS